jgi:hypothetical protein
VAQCFLGELAGFRVHHRNGLLSCMEIANLLAPLSC